MRAADIAADNKLSPDDKSKALNNWEQEARQLPTASNEGMAGSADGLEPDDPAWERWSGRKAEIGEKPKPKPSH